MESEYLKTLMLNSRDIGERYKMKMGLINNLDPFTLDSDADLDYSIDAVPPVTFMDIAAYLVLTHSFYSQVQMKAYKSLESYKYFQSGLVVRVATKMENNLFILVGQVKHSQRVNVKPLDVWCIVSKDGSICTAHCTCMAGNSEVCSHIGAILFAAEYANSRREAISCTDVGAVWPMPSMSKKVDIVPAHEMDWGKTTHQQESSSLRGIEVPTLSGNEMVDMLETMSKLGYSCPLMRIVEPFATQISQNRIGILVSRMSIFDENNINKSYSELMRIAKKSSISLTDEEITKIEEATRQQSQNINWYQQRAGRITASKLKSVCRTNKEKPSLSLIKLICYPTKMPFYSKAISWGISNENKAVEEYKKFMEEENHEFFNINEVGLLINGKWPQLGASPDRLVFCECCLGGCLEVKCPYLLHTNNVQDIQEYLTMKSSCLVELDGKITLDKKHSYYYQVQMQIFVSQLLYCDFVIWSPNLFFHIRILPDITFWENCCTTALKFHSEVIMPELLGKYFTIKEGAAKISHYCICKGVDDGTPMIRCDGDACETEWFHFQCVGLDHTPDCAWYCSNCLQFALIL